MKARNFGKQIRIPHDQIGFRGNRHAIAVTQQQFQRAARQALVLFKGIIGIAHRAHAHHALAGMAAQLTFQQLQRILFAPHAVEFMHLITGGAAVAINTAVAAPPVEIDVPAMTEPAFAGAALHQLPGLHLFHALPPFDDRGQTETAARQLRNPEQQAAHQRIKQKPQPLLQRHEQQPAHAVEQQHPQREKQHDLPRNRKPHLHPSCKDMDMKPVFR